jgi:hypothetical protein
MSTLASARFSWRPVFFAHIADSPVGAACPWSR